jgi:hypothetical protein
MASEAGSGEVMLREPSGPVSLNLPVAFISALQWWERWQEALIVPRWNAESRSDDAGYHLALTDRSGSPVVAESFDRRIELAASHSSSSGRFLVFVQANNVASVVTVLDAQRGASWSVLLPHDATLAAYAISIVFAPTEHCVAVSQQRIDGPGPETWLLDLEARAVGPVQPGFVVTWLG